MKRASTTRRGHVLSFNAGSPATTADFGNDVIRKVDAATGTVTLLAGQYGIAGHADGNGAAATLGQPKGLVHVSGVLYCEYVVWRQGVMCGRVMWVPRCCIYHIILIACPTAYRLHRLAQDCLFGQTWCRAENTKATRAAVDVFRRPRVCRRDNMHNALPPSSFAVADYSSYTVRQIAVSSGAVSLFAGIYTLNGVDDGPRGTATFDSPVYLAASLRSTLFVTNDVVSLLREVELPT
eukprot:360913-Chlamydomonas_euryale.AAC.1